LSYAAVLKTPEPRHMGLVPDSVFYFESELRLQSLVLQRRRWLNGSVAGYLWMIVKEPKILFHMTADNFRKIYVWFLMLLQLLLFALEWISPLMFGYGTRVSLIFGYGLKQWTGEVAGGCFMGLYAVFSLVHWKKKFNSPLWALAFIASVAAITIQLSGLIYYMVVNADTNGLDNLRYVRDIVTFQDWRWPTPYEATGLLFLMIVIPLIVTLIRPSSFLLTLLSTPLFYLAIPLMVCFFPAYAFARCHDLSWGNRPADQMKDVDKEDREKLEKKFTGTALMIVLFGITVNVGLYLLAIWVNLDDFFVAIIWIMFANMIVSIILSICFFLWWFGHRLWVWIKTPDADHLKGIKHPVPYAHPYKKRTIPQSYFDGNSNGKSDGGGPYMEPMAQYPNPYEAPTPSPFTTYVYPSASPSTVFSAGSTVPTVQWW
jgi:hypothetical protein